MAPSVNIPAAMKNMTLLPPPPGVRADVENRKFYGTSMTVVASICLPIVLVLCAMTPVGLAFIALNVAIVHGGAYGYHSWDVTLGDLTDPVMERTRVLGVFSAPVFFLVKLNIFCFILAAFGTIVWLRRLVYAGIGVCAMFYLFIALYFGIACGKTGDINKGESPSMCDSLQLTLVVTILNGAFNIFSDFYLLLIPLPAIQKLQLPRRKKLGVYFVFFTGFGACIMSIVALHFRLKLTKSTDPHYDTVPMLSITVVEVAVGMVIPTSASVATAGRLIHGRIQSHLSAVYGSNTSNGKQSANTSGDPASNELENFRQVIMRHERAHSPSGSIDRLVFGATKITDQIMITSSSSYGSQSIKE